MPGCRTLLCLVVTWLCVVYTADEHGAGTDANVQLVIYGKNEKGESVKSDDVKLDNRGDNFESGQEDQFKIETIDVGRPYKIRVGHDNAASFAAWKLDRVRFLIIYILDRIRLMFQSIPVRIFYHHTHHCRRPSLRLQTKPFHKSFYSSFSKPRTAFMDLQKFKMDFLVLIGSSIPGFFANYRATRMHSADYPSQDVCPSVCPSVRPLHAGIPFRLTQAGILWTPLNISSKFSDH